MRPVRPLYRNSEGGLGFETDSYDKIYPAYQPVLWACSLRYGQRTGQEQRGA